MKIVEAGYRLAIALWAGGNAIFTLLLTPILFTTGIEGAVITA